MNQQTTNQEAVVVDPQRAWDECLCAAWRADGAVLYAVNEWQRITKLSFIEHQPMLRRTPALGYPWKFRMRVFVAQHLDKINTRLWDQPPSRDAAMIDKLQTSSYTTHRTSLPDNASRELRREQKKVQQNRAVMSLDRHNHSERNSATDWNFTKASPRRVGGRG